eukprot:snap_masked-scaffold370_size193435-processed-gene-0.7 protein:Tk07795 transcript:snap_masked-scaffold370_size193435-processed-gene-0.7-mRNA-1 annotation:"connectin related family member (rbc-1)"
MSKCRFCSELTLAMALICFTGHLGRVSRRFLNLRQVPHPAAVVHSARLFSEAVSSGGGEAEKRLVSILQGRFPEATDIAVVDISGGCGSMYEVFVQAPDFKGLRIVKQHQIVTDALKAEIPSMHGPLVFPVP